MASDSESAADFRERLAKIPKIEEEPVGDLWSLATPPIVRPPAPVARPAVPQTTGSTDEHFLDQHFPAEHVPDEHVPAEKIAVADEEAVPTIAPQRRRRWPLFLIFLLLLLATIIIIPLFLATRVFDSVERVPLGDSLVAPLAAGTNVLLVGTDSREGIDTETENSQVILGEGLAGERTDTIMILRLAEDGNTFLSLPRDLWLPIDGGDPQRINAAFARGPEALVNTVQSELGVPISHFVQVDLAGFIDLVDAVGGVEIMIENPAFDRNSGLDLPTAGTVLLDSTQALAFVRSRFYTEIIDGVEVADPTSDLGRIQRQQEFLRALFSKVSAERNPATLNSMGSAIAEALVIDDETSLTNALILANELRMSSPASVTLPTSPTTTGGGAQVLTLNAESPAVLAQFGG